MLTGAGACGAGHKQKPLVILAAVMMVVLVLEEVIGARGLATLKGCFAQRERFSSCACRVFAPMLGA